LAGELTNKKRLRQVLATVKHVLILFLVPHGSIKTYNFVSTGVFCLIKGNICVFNALPESITIYRIDRDTDT